MHGRTRRSLQNLGEERSGFFKRMIAYQEGRLLESGGPIFRRSEGCMKTGLLQLQNSRRSREVRPEEKISLGPAKFNRAHSLVQRNRYFRHEDGAGVEFQDRSLQRC